MEYLKELRMNRIHYAGPSITEVEQAVIKEVMHEQNWYCEPYKCVESFEKEFAAFHDRKYALMTTNCTSALFLTLKALGIGPGDEVIVPDLTWIASVSPVVALGATPVFVDVTKDWVVDVEKVERAVTRKTAAVIAVDLYGNMPNYEKLIKELEPIPVFEDAAEAFGSQQFQKRAGSFGYASVFSFHRTKTLTTGEGGMLLTDNDGLYYDCKRLRDSGREACCSYTIKKHSMKYLPTNLQGALGYAQLQRAGQLIQIKRHILATYREALKGLAVRLNHEPESTINGAWVTGVNWDRNVYDIESNEMEQKLLEYNIPAKRFFRPLSLQPVFMRDPQSICVEASRLYQFSITLPSAMNLTDKQLHYVAGKFRKILERAKR